MTIRDTINRQKESREAAERAKQERFAKAEAEALAREKAKEDAKEDARLLAIAQAKAQKIAEDLAKATAKAEAHAAIEAEAKAKHQAKLQAKAEVEAQKQAQIDAKVQAKADAEAGDRAKQDALVKAKSARQALVLAEEKTRLEAEALAKKKARLEAEALAKKKQRLEAQAVAKAESSAKELAKIQVKEEAQAKAAQEAKAKAAAKKEAKLKAEQARQAKADAKAAKEANLVAKAKEEALVIEAEKAEAAAKEKEQARAIAKAELKEKAREKSHEKALLKAQKRSEVWENIKKTSEQKVQYLVYLLVEAKEHIRSYVRHIATIYSKLNLRRYARIAYSGVILGVVVLMTQVFMERYPHTSTTEIVYELPIDPGLAVIDSPEHVVMSRENAPLAIEENLTVTVTSSVSVFAPPKQKPLPLPNTAVIESEPDLITKPKPEAAIAPAAASVAMLANWQMNAVESDIPASSPRLVVVIDDLGMSTRVSQKIAKLPTPLTLAFLPYATQLGYQSRLVASYGHELLVHMPMAPKNLNVNPGNNALLDDLDKIEFERRLNWNLSRFTGFIGINNHMGSSLTEHTKEMSWVMAELKNRGLVFLDSVTTSETVAASQAHLAGVPTLSRNVFLDNVRDPAAILKQLKRAMRMSQVRGLSIAIGHPYPETLAVLKEWLPKLNGEGIILTPLSAAISEKYFPKTMLASKDASSLARAK